DRRLGEPVAAERRRCGAKRGDLGVRGGIVGRYRAVVTLADDNSTMNGDRADRNLAGSLCSARLGDCYRHQGLVAGGGHRGSAISQSMQRNGRANSSLTLRRLGLKIAQEG